MSNEWIIIELMTILMEKFAVIYFLNFRYQKKYSSSWPNLGTWILLVICGVVIAPTINIVHAIVTHAIMLIYLMVFKYGTIFNKIFGVLIVFAVLMTTSIVGAGIASLITSTSIEHTLLYQDTSRMFALIFIKTLQVVIFYILAKRHEKERSLRKRPAIFLFIAVAINFAYLIMLRLYVESPDLQPQQNHLLVWLAVGALIIMIGIFLIYELFIREEARNVDLAMKLQRTKMEARFLQEMDKLYSEIRIWRHDYENNLKVLRTLITETATDKALNFMDGMNSKVMDSKIVLQTGNLALDAIINGKLALAKTHGIEVDVKIVYPENNYISDNDLCAITGNSIDNAIEACLRITDGAVRKFIDIEMEAKKKNLCLIISNSYNNEIKQKGGQFITSKKEPNHGIGIKHVDTIINKYHGYVERSPDNGVFVTSIMLPLEPQKI